MNGDDTAVGADLSRPPPIYRPPETHPHVHSKKLKFIITPVRMAFPRKDEIQIRCSLLHAPQRGIMHEILYMQRLPKDKAEGEGRKYSAYDTP